MLLGDELFQLRGLAAVLLVRAILARLGAGRQPVGEAVLLAKPLDLGVAELHAADVDLREDQQPGRFAFRLVVARGGLQRLEPVAGLGKGIVLLRIDQQQRQRGFVEKELMDQPVILLPGQVPEQRLALQRGVGRERQIQPPDVHAMRAVADDVVVFDQAMRQRGLAHRPLAEQHDFGIHVAARRLGRRRGADAGEAIDVDRRRRRAHHEPRTIGTEGDGNRRMHLRRARSPASTPPISNPRAGPCRP